MPSITYPEPAHTANVVREVAETTSLYEGLPNRLLTAFEVAEFVGCHEETVVARTCAACWSRNASALEEGGSIPQMSSTGFVEEFQRKSRNQKEDLYGCSKALPQQRLQVEPALRASVVVGCHAQPRTVSDACRLLRDGARRDGTGHVQARSREGLATEVHRRDRLRERSPRADRTRDEVRTTANGGRPPEAVSHSLRRGRAAQEPSGGC